jgi:uncharacterized protein GlcG (DUF336 family)
LWLLGEAFVNATPKTAQIRLIPIPAHPDGVQPGQPLFPLISQGRYCAMGGGAPLISGGQVIAGVGVSGGTVEQDIAILEAGLIRALVR